MPALHVPDDLLENYAWMRRTVLGLLDQSINTLHRPAYGNNDRVFLKAGKGWETHLGEVIFRPRLVAVNIADHLIIQGAIKWVKGTDNRAAILPLAITPPDELEFFTTRDDGTEIIVRITPDGYIRMPSGNASIVNLYLKCPTPLGGG